MKNENKKGTIQLYVRLKVLRKDGSVKYDSGKRKSKCFVLQFLQIIAGYFKNATVSGCKDVTGTDRTVGRPPSPSYSEYFYSRINAPAGEDTYGIVVGTGTAAVANDNYALESKCDHGTGANQFLYGSMGFTEPEVVAGNVDYVIERSFTNGSGSTITVNEVGIYAYMYDATGPNIRYFCIIRDLTGGIAVGAEEVLVVEYTVRTTV